MGLRMPENGWRAKLSKCNDCKYRTYLNTKICCGYILITWHRRGCPGGDNCTKHESGAALKLMIDCYGRQKHYESEWQYEKKVNKLISKEKDCLEE